MAKTRTQLEQAQKAADNIVFVMKRAAEEIAKDLKALEEVMEAAQNDGSIDSVNWNVFKAIAQDARAFSFAAVQVRRIVAPTPLGRRR